MGAVEDLSVAPLWVALLSVPSRSGLVRNGMICLGSSSSPHWVPTHPLYTEIGWVHGSLEGMSL
jgi:hypothetical protein